MRSKKQGHILLLVLFLSAIVLTIGLAISSQTLTDIKVSTQQSDYTRAFSAAEAGIEELLSYNSGEGLAGLAGLSCNSSANVCDQSSIGSSGDLDYKFFYTESATDVFEYSDSIANGDVFELNLQGHTISELNILWTSGSEHATVELIFGYDSNNSIYRLMANPQGYTDCNNNTDVEAAVNSSETGLGRDYDFEYTVSQASILQGADFVRVRPICAQSTYFAFMPASGEQLPVQSYLAHVEKQSGENIAAIETEQTAHKFLPGVFDFVLYSGQGID